MLITVVLDGEIIDNFYFLKIISYILKMFSFEQVWMQSLPAAVGIGDFFEVQLCFPCSDNSHSVLFKDPPLLLMTNNE